MLEWPGLGCRKVRWMHRSTQPATRLLSLAAMLLAAGCARPGLAGERTGTISGTIRVADATLLKLCAVYLEDPHLRRTVPRRAARIAQADKRFDPPLTVVVAGTTVEFPNLDKVFHNVFSPRKGFEFDLGLYKSGTSRSFRFDRPGFTDVYCNIHPDMFGSVLVVPNDYHAVPDPDGAFKIEGVPEGRYTLVGWIALGPPRRISVVVRAGSVANASIPPLALTRSRLHRRKDGTAYDRVWDW